MFPFLFVLRRLAVILLVALALPTALVAEEPPLRANELNFFCASGGGWKDGECGNVLGCLISEALGLFDCYQIIDGKAGARVDITQDYGFDNPFLIDALNEMPQSLFPAELPRLE